MFKLYWAAGRCCSTCGEAVMAAGHGAGIGRGSARRAAASRAGRPRAPPQPRVYGHSAQPISKHTRAVREPRSPERAEWRAEYERRTGGTRASPARPTATSLRSRLYGRRAWRYAEPVPREQDRATIDSVHVATALGSRPVRGLRPPARPELVDEEIGTESTHGEARGRRSLGSSSGALRPARLPVSESTRPWPRTARSRTSGSPP